MGGGLLLHAAEGGFLPSELEGGFLPNAAEGAFLLGENAPGFSCTRDRGFVD